MRWLFAVSIALALVVLACKEEWTPNELHVLNPVSETDDTQPADDSEDATSDTTTTAAPLDAGADAADAKPSDARADVRDATNG